jgi:hypothetical protein
LQNCNTRNISRETIDFRQHIRRCTIAASGARMQRRALVACHPNTFGWSRKNSQNKHFEKFGLCKFHLVTDLIFRKTQLFCEIILLDYFKNIALASTDMRRSINGLGVLVTEKFDLTFFPAVSMLLQSEAESGQDS